MDRAALERLSRAELIELVVRMTEMVALVEAPAALGRQRLQAGDVGRRTGVVDQPGAPGVWRDDPHVDLDAPPEKQQSRKR